MANFRTGKLARKKNGRFHAQQKTKTGNYLLSQNKTSSDSLDDAKVSFQSESETALSGRHVVEGSRLVTYLVLA